MASGNAFARELEKRNSGARTTEPEETVQGNAFARELQGRGLTTQRGTTAQTMHEAEVQRRMLENNLARTYSDKEYATQKQEQALRETDVEDLDQRIGELERYIEQTKIDISLPWEKQQKELDELKRQRELARSAQYDAAGTKALADLDAGYLETLDKLLALKLCTS